MPVQGEVHTVTVKRKLTAAVRHLSSEANALEPLEAAGAITALCTVLGHAGHCSPIDEELRQSAMAALYHLCKTNRAAQEQVI